MLWKFPLVKIHGTKYAVFFLSLAPTHHSFTFNLQFSYELEHKDMWDMYVRFSILDSVSFFESLCFI